MKRFLVLAICLISALALVSCDLSWLPIDIPGVTDKTPDEDGAGEDQDKDQIGGEQLEGLVLISGGKALFRVVHTTDAGGTGAREADNLVKKLRGFGIEIEDPVSDKNARDVTDCEIIIGVNAKNRGEECVISDKKLGEDGYAIKTVGKRIIVAGGSQKRTADAMNLFKREYLGITEKTKEFGPSFAIAEEINVIELTKYLISSITVAGNDLSDYVIAKDVASLGHYSIDFIEEFRRDLYEESGYWLEIVDIGDAAADARKIVIRHTTEAIPGDTKNAGFAVRVDDSGDLYFETRYANALEKYFEEFVTVNILDKMGEVEIRAGLFETKIASVVTYEEFGAVGNGRTDDFDAILAAHKYANECGQTVKGKEGAIYFIDKKFVTSVPVKTNVDLCGATILVNDVGDDAHAKRGLPFFKIAREDSGLKWISDSGLDEMFGDSPRTLSRDAVSMPWIVPYLDAKSFVILVDSTHMDFVRYGANQDAGTIRQDLFVVDTDGSIDPSTAPAFEFTNITKVEIYRMDDEPITIENGSFKNITCRTVAETNFKNVYRGYHRGIEVYRSNVTIKNMTFRTVDEPTIDRTVDPNDPLCASYGKRAESYPYGGFITGSKLSGLTVMDCTMSARTVYYEDKPATESTGGKVPAPVPMGSYGYTYSLTNDVNHINVDQYSETGIGDSRYWGIMNSNTCKNFTFDQCEVNRFDAHRGFWNASLTNMKIGHTINLTGGGYLYIENLEKLCGNNFLSLRGDYGSSFDGEIYIKDTIYYGYYGYDSLKGGVMNDTAVYPHETFVINGGFQSTEHYLNWDFGYPCTLPHKITFDNFVSVPPSIFVYSDVSDVCFENDYSFRYGLTSEIVYKNMEARIPKTRDASCTYLNSVPETFVND